MTKSYFLSILFGFYLTSSVVAECETGWTQVKGETCIKAFTDLLTYDEAKSFCASESTPVATASLVMVKDEEMQELLARYTEDKFENFWLGAKYDNSSGDFKWEDGNPLTYTNWATGYPRNITTADYCIQLRPVNAKVTTDLDGKWEDAVCQRRNLAMCQRSLPWSLEDATREIQRLRMEFEAVSSGFAKKLVRVKSQLETVTSELDAVNSRVVPIGSIYVEYFNQSSPVTLWPALSWQEVTGSYANLFFRAYGNDTAGWGTTQNECAPRITQTSWYTFLNQTSVRHLLKIPSNGWSEYGHVGHYCSSCNGIGYYEGLKFNTVGCEVRPRNQAIRIWKRLG